MTALPCRLRRPRRAAVADWIQSLAGPLLAPGIAPARRGPTESSVVAQALLPVAPSTSADCRQPNKAAARPSQLRSVCRDLVVLTRQSAQSSARLARQLRRFQFVESFFLKMLHGN